MLFPKPQHERMPPPRHSWPRTSVRRNQPAMTISEAHLLSRPAILQQQSYDIKDSILYALGIGFGADDTIDAETLRYLYEPELIVFPTMALVLGAPPKWLADPSLGINYGQILHGEESLRLHRALAPSGHVRTSTTILAVHDKGVGKGAVMRTERQLTDADSGEPIATIESGYYLRGEGGFGGSAGTSNTPAVTPPDRQADWSIDMRTRADQALIYRLSGDFNPLHVDPAAAADAGFDRPVLHGLCSMGLAGRAAVRLPCEGAPERLRQLDVRFAGPVFPGETIRFSIWLNEPGLATFTGTVTERDSVVLSHGLIRYVPTP